MPRRIASLILTLCLLATLSLPALATETDVFEVRDLYCRRYMTSNLTEAVVSHSGTLTFYSDEALTDVVADPDQRIYRDTQYWVREERDGEPVRIRSFWAYVSNTTISYDVGWAEGTRYVKLKLKVDDMPGMAHATGYLSLYNGDTFVKNLPLSWGEADYSWTAPSLKNYTLRVEYKGDDYYDPYVTTIPVSLELDMD